MRVRSRVAAPVTLPGGDLNPGPLGLEPPTSFLPSAGRLGGGGRGGSCLVPQLPGLPLTRHRSPASVCPSAMGLVYLFLFSSDFLLFSRHCASTRLKCFMGMNALTLLRDPGGGALV